MLLLASSRHPSAADQENTMCHVKKFVACFSITAVAFIGVDVAGLTGTDGQLVVRAERDCC